LRTWLPGAAGNLKPELTRIAFTFLLAPAASKLNLAPDFETFWLDSPGRLLRRNDRPIS
jgi:hypothetical protein